MTPWRAQAADDLRLWGAALAMFAILLQALIGWGGPGAIAAPAVHAVGHHAGQGHDHAQGAADCSLCFQCCPASAADTPDDSAGILLRGAATTVPRRRARRTKRTSAASNPGSARGPPRTA